MEYPTVREKETYFALENQDFIINLDKAGNILGWQIKNKGITLISTISFEDKINKELEEPFLTLSSTSVVFEKDFTYGQLKKVFNIRKKTLIVDIYLTTFEASSISYEFCLKFNKWMDYMMISKEKFLGC